MEEIHTGGAIAPPNPPMKYACGVKLSKGWVLTKSTNCVFAVIAVFLRRALSIVYTFDTTNFIMHI